MDDCIIVPKRKLGLVNAMRKRSKNALGLRSMSNGPYVRNATSLTNKTITTVTTKSSVKEAQSIKMLPVEYKKYLPDK